jgi:hypothetical protein
LKILHIFIDFPVSLKCYDALLKNGGSMELQIKKELLSSADVCITAASVNFISDEMEYFALS